MLLYPDKKIQFHQPETSLLKFRCSLFEYSENETNSFKSNNPEIRIPTTAGAQHGIENYAFNLSQPPERKVSYPTTFPSTFPKPIRGLPSPPANPVIRTVSPSRMNLRSVPSGI